MPLNNCFSWVAFLKTLMGQRSKKLEVVQGSVLRLLARSYQNPKIGNKIIVKLMKNFKSMYFHCDVTDDVSIFTHNA